jgi:hypothetical protein
MASPPFQAGMRDHSGSKTAIMVALFNHSLPLAILAIASGSGFRSES